MKTWKLRLSKSGAIEFISSDGDHLALDDIAFYLNGLEREVARKRAAEPEQQALSPLGAHRKRRRKLGRSSHL